MVCRLGIPAQQLILCQYQFLHYRRAFVPNGYLHIIITSYDRKPIFIENIDILRTAFKKTKTIYEFEIIAICVLLEMF